MIYKTGDCGSVCNWGRVFKLIRVLLLFTASVVSDSLRSHGLQHARLPCPSPSPGLCSNSCTLSQWCHPIILTSVAPFSSCPQSFPASGSFPTSQLFASGSQSIGASGSASILPMNIRDWFPLGLTGLIPLQSKGLSRDFSSTIWKHPHFYKWPTLISFNGWVIFRCVCTTSPSIPLLMGI